MTESNEKIYLRQLCIPLTEKIKLRHQLNNRLNNSVDQNSLYQNSLQSLHHYSRYIVPETIETQILKTTSSCFNVFNLFKHLWSNQLYTIESIFGNVVSSYFSFHRYLFLNNLCSAIVILAFIVLPQVILIDDRYNDDNFNGIFDHTEFSVNSRNISLENDNLQNAFFINNLQNFNFISNSSLQTNLFLNKTCYKLANDPFYDQNTKTSIQPTFTDYLLNIFTGTGVFFNTPLFYGYYKRFSTYNLPLAYILTPLILFVANVFLFAQNAAFAVTDSIQVYQYSKLKTANEISRDYFSTLFSSGYDFAIHDSSLQKSRIKLTLLGKLNEEKARYQTEHTSFKLLKRISTWMFVILMIAASGALIFYCTITGLTKSEKLKQNKNVENVKSSNYLEVLFYEYLPSLSITACNLVFPTIFIWIKTWNIENYIQKTAVNITLLRIVILRYMSVMFLIIGLWIKLTCKHWDYEFSNETFFDENCNFCTGIPCWETLIGQEMYKLTISIVLFGVIKIVFIEYLLNIITSRLDTAFKPSLIMKKILDPFLIFDTIYSVLDLVYLQMVTWIGSFFSPLLPVFTTVSLFGWFYLKFYSTKQNMKPESVIYEYCKEGWFFFFILSGGFVCAVFVVVYAIGVSTPSLFCGPYFQNQHNFSSNLTMWTMSVAESETVRNSEFLMVFGKWYVGAGLCLVLNILIFYLRQSGINNKEIAKTYASQLHVIR